MKSTCPQSNGTITKQMAELAYSLGIQAYIYGYPLVVMQTLMAHDVATKAPFNKIYNNEGLASPVSRPFVTPNRDTLYSTAWLYLENQCVTMHIPPGTHRYFTIQFLDMYTNTFYNIRASNAGPHGAEFLIVGPNWNRQGHYFQNPYVIQAPTNQVYVVARAEVKRKNDLPAVIQLASQLKVHGCNHTPKQPAPPEDALTSLSFFTVMIDAMRKNPPPLCDTVLLEQFKLIGIDPVHGFHPDRLPIEVKTSLEKAVRDGKCIVETGSIYFNQRTKNGWEQLVPTGTYGNQFLARAFVAHAGLAANVPTEEIYLHTQVDAQENTLDGSKRYTIHLTKNQYPKVAKNGFWSLTLYDHAFNLVPNQLDRFSIGTNTEGLEYQSDGSLDIVIQHTSPDHTSNWLPAPTGEFYLILRIFDPQPTQINHFDNIPPVTVM